jgi:ABC-type lipopolysaccharide export system ATPase subunit
MITPQLTPFNEVIREIKDTQRVSVDTIQRAAAIVLNEIDDQTQVTRREYGSILEQIQRMNLKNRSEYDTSGGNRQWFEAEGETLENPEGLPESEYL